MAWLRAAVVALLAALAGAMRAEPPAWKELYVDVPFDHFDEQVQGTFKLRYLLHDGDFAAKQSPPSPVLFYTGNEGDVESFWNNTGLVFDWAKPLGALVVFAEHRYYGKSLPFAERSWDKGKVGFLSIEQALADFAKVVADVKIRYNAEDSPVVSFGGSYGGMLSAWFRLKYPYVVDMALAASAPIPLASVNNTVPNNGYWKTTTDDADWADPACPDNVRRFWYQINELAKKGAPGLQEVQQGLGICEPIETQADLDYLVLWASNAWGTMAMVNYPYSADFQGALPPRPINQACAMMSNHSSPMDGMSAALSMLYGPPSPCREMRKQYVFCADQSGCGTGPAGKSWDYQVCTEIIYVLETNNISDMFPPRVWSIEDLKAYCHDKWGVVPRPDFIATHFGGANISFGSRIIFSNGLQDPWHTGGFLEPLNEALPAVVIPSGAHHLDLRGAHPDDPLDVIAARKQELGYIQGWLKEVYGEKGLTPEVRE